MTERIAIIILVATLFYVIIPLAFRLAVASRRKKLLRFLQSANGVFAVCSSWHNETLTIDPVGTGKTEAGTADALPFNVAPARTRFYVLESEGSLERAAWNTISLIKRGVTLMYFPGRSRRSRGMCVFHEETSEKRLRERFASLALETRYGSAGELRVKYMSVAIGVFIEFLLFLESLSDESARIVSVSALIAIFGKALPYCPPGLFFSLASRFVTGKGNPQKKKPAPRGNRFRSRSRGNHLKRWYCSLLYRPVRLRLTRR